MGYALENQLKLKKTIYQRDKLKMERTHIYICI